MNSHEAGAFERPCIEVLDEQGQRIEVVTVIDLVDFVIQDDEIGLRIVRDLDDDGRYLFAGDGDDPATEQTFCVIDGPALTAQLRRLEQQLGEE